MSFRLIPRLRMLTVPRTRARLYSSSDPFILPLSREATERQTPTETPLPPRVQRDNETITALRARLVYQSRKRGMLEGDLILSTFAAENLHKMSEDELKEYDRLLDEPDWDIYYWAIEKKEPPSRWKDTDLLEKLRVHARNEGKVVRKMPDLAMQ